MQVDVSNSITKQRPVDSRWRTTSHPTASLRRTDGGFTANRKTTVSIEKNTVTSSIIKELGEKETTSTIYNLKWNPRQISGISARFRKMFNCIYYSSKTWKPDYINLIIVLTVKISNDERKSTGSQKVRRRLTGGSTDSRHRLASYCILRSNKMSLYPVLFTFWKQARK